MCCSQQALDTSVKTFAVPAQELKEQKEELLTKVQALKTDLQDWRTKLEAQVKTYKSVSDCCSSWSTVNHSLGPHAGHQT